MASVTTATTGSRRILFLGFRASEYRHDFAAFTCHLQQLPSPLAHVRPPADELFPLLGAGSENTQIGDVLPVWRIWGGTVWLGHRGGSGGTISRVLFTRWYEQMVISLGRLSPAISCGLPAARTTRAGSRCLLGLAPTGGCRATPVTRRAVGSYPTFSPLPFGYKGGLFSVALFRRLTAPRRYLAVCPVELGLSSMGLDDPPRPSAPPLPGDQITGPPGLPASLQRVTRLIMRAMLSGAARSSQNPSCAPKTSGRTRFHSLAPNVLRSGSRRTAASA